jgi:ribosomal protein L37E
MTKEHPIGRIAHRQKDYKSCRRCRKINWHKNSCCNACGYRRFSPMDDDNGRNLLLDWEKEPDLLVEV